MPRLVDVPGGVDALAEHPGLVRGSEPVQQDRLDVLWLGAVEHDEDLLFEAALGGGAEDGSLEGAFLAAGEGGGPATKEIVACGL